MHLVMTVFPGRFTVHRLAPETPIPSALLEQDLYAVFRSGDELSVVCSQQVSIDSERSVSDWAMLKVQGPLDLSLKGIMAKISAALADADVAIFVVSSFDTDYVLVAGAQLERAVEALRATGIEIP